MLWCRSTCMYIQNAFWALKGAIVQTVQVGVVCFSPFHIDLPKKKTDEKQRISKVHPNENDPLTKVLVWNVMNCFFSCWWWVKLVSFFTEIAACNINYYQTPNEYLCVPVSAYSIKCSVFLVIYYEIITGWAVQKRPSCKQIIYQRIFIEQTT